MSENNLNWHEITKVIERADEILSEIQSVFVLKGKTFRFALTEQADWFNTVDQIRVELYSIREAINTDINKKKGELWKNLTIKSSVALNSKDKEMYANADDDLNKLIKAYNIVNKKYLQFQSVVDGLKQRSFVLKNLVELHLQSSLDEQIY